MKHLDRALTLGAIVLICGNGFGAPKRSAHPRAKLAAALASSIEEPTTYRCLRVDVRGDLGGELYAVSVYGRGFGTWNGARQFPLSKAQIRHCLEALEAYDFVSMPDEIESGAPAERHTSSPAGPGADDAPVVRSITLVVAGMRKTVSAAQDASAAEAFTKMGAAIVSICKTAAAQGFIDADGLEDGLQKIASGALAPELLEITLSAPELRSLKSQQGQGWKVTVSKSRLTAQRWTLADGPGAPTQQWLSDDEVRSLAAMLVSHHVATLPVNIDMPGYTQLSVKVLGRHRSIMARPLTGRNEQESRNVEHFGKIRAALFDLFTSAAPSSAR